MNHPKNSNALCAYLREKRKKAGLSLEDIARELGASVATPWNYEKNHLPPCNDTLRKYLRLINASPDRVRALLVASYKDEVGGIL